MEVSGQLNSLAPVPLGNGAHFPLNRRLHVIWGWLNAFKKWHILLLPGIEPWLLGCPSFSLVTMNTAVLAALCTTFITVLTIYVWCSRGRYPTPEHFSYISHSLIPFHYISCMLVYSMWAGDISLNVAECHIMVWWKNLLNVVNYLPICHSYSHLADMRTE